VGRESPLVGRTLKEVGGRSGYRAAAVAIHRAGERVGGKLGDVELHAGDTLVLLAGSDLRRARGAMADFLVLAPLAHAVPVISRGARWVALALAVFVVCATTEVVTVLEASLLAAGIVVAARVVTFAEAKRSIDRDVVMIAASLGIGTAVEASGLAADISAFATDRLGFAGVAGVVLGILITTTILTEIVTNNAAAAVVVPIAIIAAQEVGLDYRVMAVGVAVMASSSFLTPIGYQTNAMVYGPGGYRFADFTRVGGLLNLTVLAVTTAMVVALG
jgi:di/tricarboxylate transporter